MLAILKAIKKQSFKTKDNKSFSKVCFTVAVKVDDNDTVHEYSGSYGIDFAKRYFDRVKTITGKKITDFIGQEVNVMLERKYRNEKFFSIVKYLNFFDNDGKLIFPFENNTNEDDDIEL